MRAVAGDRHVHLGMALHRSDHAAIGLCSGLVDEPVAQEAAKKHAISTIMIGPPMNSASGELPTQRAS